MKKNLLLIDCLKVSEWNSKPTFRDTDLEASIIQKNSLMLHWKMGGVVVILPVS